jgi:uncharacterized membrane protein YphA (DoxX/SURF4 family)
MIDVIELLVAAPDRRIRERLRPTRIAIITGVIFFFAGLVKFVFHHWELHAFRSFGLPWASAMEIVAGVVEIFGGVLRVTRRAVVPVTVVLAVTMLVAIIASGIGHGDVIPSLTLAPALLLAEEIPLAASFLAGHAHIEYRRAGGNRHAILPDFLIGAHAAVTGRPLLTRDPARVASYIPGTTIISP